MSKKVVWLINAYAMPPDREQRIQTLKRAEYLNKNGFEVYVIAGSHLHNTNTNLILDKRLFINKQYDGVNYIHVRNRSYTNYISRIYSLVEFYIRIFRVNQFIPKPDFISLYASIPFSNIIYFLAKRNGAKLIIEVVDLWPESFVSLNLISRYNPILWLFYLSEKWIYKKADKIVFSMEGGRKYLIDKKWDIQSGGSIDLRKTVYINNGVDLKDFNFNKSNYIINDNDLNDNQSFKVIYVGSIRLANGVNLILDAAKKLININEIKFLIFGDGPEREIIEKRIVEENISNVILKHKWVEFKYIPYILSKSSINLLNYAKNPIFRYGGSQSKSFQYMASGKPICSNLKMGFCPITKFNLGIADEFKNPDEYASAIFKLFKLPIEQYNEICKNSLEAAKNYDYEYLTTRYISECLE